MDLEIRFTEALRARNRALVIVNRKLRKRQEDVVAQRDEVVESLLTTPNPAEEAFGELWGSALFDCGPEDYVFMVEDIKKAFKELEGYKAQKPEAHSHPLTHKNHIEKHDDCLECQVS